MQRAAIYCRYSTDEQRETSIEDQLRRNRQKAVELGYEVPDELVFSDSAISGTKKGRQKRAGYKALLRAWDSGAFSAVFSDELSRLARDPMDLAQLQERIERGGVRLVCADGLDTGAAGWQLRFGLSGLIAAEFIRETRHRVMRGMVGQLARGFMIAAAPFGYAIERAESPVDAECGTNWVVVEEQAIWVREIFALRRRGTALGGIARVLNQAGVPCPRPSRTGGLRYWRPATVRQLLRNTIYRGVFVWNGSAFSKALAKREKRVLTSKEFERPHLRLVDDQTWFLCNREGVSRTGRGGGRHALAGLVSCGVCGATLSVHNPNSAPVLHCAQCGQAARVGYPERRPPYVSGHGIELALVAVLERVWTPAAIQAFRDALRKRLGGDRTAELTQQKEKFAQAERAVQRLARLIRDVDAEDAALEIEYREAVARKRQLQRDVDGLARGLASVDRTSIEKQVAIDPRTLLPQIFGAAAAPERTRAVLARVFPRIILLRKLRRFVVEYEIHCAPGTVPAELTGTLVLDTAVTVVRVRVSTGPRRPVEWAVEIVEAKTKEAADAA